MIQVSSFQNVEYFPLFLLGAGLCVSEVAFSKTVIYPRALAFPNVYNFFSCDSCRYVMQISVSKVLVVLALISIMRQYWSLKTLEITASVIKNLKSRRALLFSCLAVPFAALLVKCLSMKSPSHSLNPMISPPPLHVGDSHTSSQVAEDKHSLMLTLTQTTRKQGTKKLGRCFCPEQRPYLLHAGLQDSFTYIHLFVRAQWQKCFKTAKQ